MDRTEEMTEVEIRAKHSTIPIWFKTVQVKDICKDDIKRIKKEWKENIYRCKHCKTYNIKLVLKDGVQKPHAKHLDPIESANCPGGSLGKNSKSKYQPYIKKVKK